MHDRRIDGQTHTFGNAGSLFMNAMTWYDHETKSIWSQPWGRALDGELKGVELFLLPSQISTWESWKEAHPYTLAMISDVSRVGVRQRFDPDFVIGLLLANKAKAFYYRDVASEVILNDMLGDIPIFVWAADDLYYAYVRQIDEQTLTFKIENGILTDAETGSTWDLDLGLATEGPLKGASMQPVPSSSAYDWAWLDFYPESEIYKP
ncbi:MAG: DUF3179 domain-containing protein [Anaerolineaceae bacterium]|nr:MAG: DUF3179 domain-containing protein [Anaerolineaceae bacterium]